MPSGRNGSNLSDPSPTPMKRTGAPVTSRTLSAAPPRASPSSLVSTTPVRSSLSWKPLLTLTASWPIIASTTRKTFSGFTAALMSASSPMSASSMARRPAVSKTMTSLTLDRASAIACLQISSGVAPGTLKTGMPTCLPRHLELLDGSGALHVGGDEERLLLEIVLEVPGELGGRGRLARALEADHHDARRARAGRGEDERLFALGRAHEGDELVVGDLGELVAGGDLHRLAAGAGRLDAYDLADGLLLDPGEEGLHHAELDVGLEQREAHLAQRHLHVGFGQLGETGEAVARLLEPFG